MTAKSMCALTLALAGLCRAAEIVRPDGEADMTESVLRAVDAVRAAGGGEVRFARGVYHFRSPAAMRFYVSNHDNPMPRNVFLPVTNLSHVALVGDGADFVFHGEGIGLALMDSKCVKVRGIRFDYATPFFTETRFLRFDGGRAVFRTAPPQFRLEVEDGQLVSVGEGWRGKPRLAGFFAGDTREFLGWVWLSGKAEALGDNTFRLADDWSSKRFLRPPVKGDVLMVRDPYRPNPAVFLCRAHDTLLEDCVIHASAGMGLIAQRSENVTVRGSGRAADRTAGSFVKEGLGRLTSLQADATHFSNCRGQVTVENCLFEGMGDDAINVHSTCLQIEGISGRSIVCRYRHAQSVGFEVFLPGERLRFIRAQTMEEVDGTVVVTSAKRMAPDLVELTLASPPPPEIGVGDAVENADWQPSVAFRGNIVRNSTPRATLFTTPGRVVCESNLFEHVAGQPIHISADAWDWYESGGCRDVTVRGNIFRDCMAVRGKGLIQISPNIRNPERQKVHYHRNIVIEGNRFEQFPVPLVYARSVSNLVWRANVVEWNTHRPARPGASFDIDRCDAVQIDSPLYCPASVP